MKVIFESQGRGKMAEKWLHKNVNISPKNCNLQKLFINITKKINLLQRKIFQDANDQLLPSRHTTSF